MIINRDTLAGVSDPQAFMDELARRDFVTFFLRAFPEIRGGAVVGHNWHIDAIAQSLDEIRLGRNRQLLVTMPPRHLKSLIISVAWVAWMLGHDPSLNFICPSYANELSAKHARDCRALMETSFYRRIFPRTTIRKSRSAVHDFETTASGGRLATSVGGTLTGRGGEFIIIDDPIKPDEAYSEVVREAANEWFFSTVLSRLNNPTTGAIIVLMQRLHQYDLVGMLLAAGWPELCLPAIGQEDMWIPLTRGRTKLFARGELLDPVRWPLAELQLREATLGSKRFAEQHLQAPLPAKGNIIKAAWLKEYEDSSVASGGGQVYQSWDTASKDGDRNDYSVCVTVLVRGRTAYVLDVWREKVDFNELWKKVPLLARRFNANALLIEDTGNGTALLQRLRNEPPAGVPTPIARRPKLDKVARLEAASTMIEAGELLLPRDAPWLATFKSELLGFPSTRHDDQIDALSQVMNWIDERQQWNNLETAGPEVYDLRFPIDRRRVSWEEFLDAWGP
jgi:predicted phage terminase large subunit-like protein